MPKSKPIKHLRFELTTKEYSDFWYVAELLGESKKVPTFLKMLDLVKKYKS